MPKPKKSNSKVLFEEIDKMEKEQHRKKARPVVEALRAAQERLSEAEDEHRRAKKKVKTINASIERYKATGDLKHLKFADQA